MMKMNNGSLNRDRITETKVCNYCLKLSLRGKFGQEKRIWDETADVT